MNRKAKPTPSDIAAAERLRLLWDAKKAQSKAAGTSFTQESAGAEMGGITQGAVSQYLAGAIPLGYGATLKFARFLDVAPSEIRPDLDALPRELEPEDDFEDVQASTQGVALGAGVAPDEYAEAHSLKFKRSSLRRKGLRPGALEIYYGSGDSMEPRIKDGDAILVDRGDTRLVDDRIYFIRFDGHFFVKRLQVHSEFTFIVSDNRDDPQWRKPILVKEGDDFEIIGRVRWIGSWED
ncbi:hypothetical protein LVB77_14725 [Lysobacter sp. 5GHs7-4]|uniref:S24 family peptidase n=1 Tax=Lysobacter sp. 5GHs7-4 TaxID=2904253 RepID=UPI001E367555|nr:S24 family peptidase [Lysobacter sp. 5GHs7-4]UHQ21920.1 hypothetical protein LVB77_14725 [Lysobacter sp. 5GHs7-4]